MLTRVESSLKNVDLVSDAGDIDDSSPDLEPVR